MSKQDTNHGEQPFVGGYIIDEKGHEQPITEDMIQQACQALQDKNTTSGSAAQQDTESTDHSR